MATAKEMAYDLSLTTTHIYKSIKKLQKTGIIKQYVELLDTDILVVSANGYGKRSSLEDYRATNRGGKGVKTISVTEKTGELVSIKNVSDENDLMIINKFITI